MASQNSTLTITLLDRVTGPSRAVTNAISRLRSSMQGLTGARTSFGQRIATDAQKATLSLSTLHSKMLTVAASTYGAQRALRSVISPTGAFETKMLDIAQKADLSNTAMEAFAGRIRQIAKEVGQAPNKVAGAADMLMGFGLDQSRTASILPAIARTAAAYRAEIDDLARAGNAALQTLHVPAGEFSRALDVMAQAGKEGAFELRDMAAHFESLTASASALSMNGVDGVAKLTAALQIARKGAADGAEAANNTSNLMQKIVSPETVKKFKKFGIDIDAERKKAQKAGGDMFEMIAQQVTKATKGDLAKLGDLFEDAQVQKFLRPLIQNLEEYKRIRDKAFTAKGVVDADFARRIKTFETGLDRFKAAMEEVRISLGNQFLPSLTRAMAAMTEQINTLDKSVNVFDRMKEAFSGFLSGLNINAGDGGVLSKLRKAIFGDAANFDADLMGLHKTFMRFREMGEALRSFTDSLSSGSLAEVGAKFRELVSQIGGFTATLGTAGIFIAAAAFVKLGSALARLATSRLGQLFMLAAAIASIVEACRGADSIGQFFDNLSKLSTLELAGLAAGIAVVATRIWAAVNAWRAWKAPAGATTPGGSAVPKPGAPAHASGSPTPGAPAGGGFMAGLKGLLKGGIGGALLYEGGKYAIDVGLNKINEKLGIDPSKSGVDGSFSGALERTIERLKSLLPPSIPSEGPPSQNHDPHSAARDYINRRRQQRSGSAEPDVNTSGLDAFKSKADQTASQAQSALSFTANPTVNQGSIDAFIAKLRTAVALMEKLGAAASGLSAAGASGATRNTSAMNT